MLFQFFLTLTIILQSVIGDYNTYPQVPKTASINGFADPIYSALPSCALSCVDISTDNTPCPYWDTGCLCVMPQWSGQVAKCIANECQGDAVKSATSLALSLCSSVGADQWVMPASISTALMTAAEVEAKATESNSEVSDASKTAISASETTKTKTTIKSSSSSKGTTSSAAIPASSAKSTASLTSSTTISKAENGATCIQLTRKTLTFLMMYIFTIFCQ